MTSLRSVLTFNMKAQRHILGITQAQLAEIVNTSTNYIALIESKKKFPTPEMLERIAAALKIDAPALFSTKSYPLPEAGTLGELQKKILYDLSEVISHRFNKFEREYPQTIESNMAAKQKSTMK
ncbi:MAG: helix-turn-helix transcriptional regulator [Treponema sp.]|nr:helix-turn-helix transcriptional regulator [Treponema sp.]